ncbi:MAG: hypothetical protein AAFQ37_04750, partial [Bacteroidota bacterium]
DTIRTLSLHNQEDCGYYQCIERDLALAGFSQPQARFLSPIFLPAKHKQLFSLLFESVMYTANDQGVLDSMEANSLLNELRAYELLPHSMISLPGVYQIVAQKRNLKSNPL